MTTNEQCLKTTLEKLEVDSKLRRQQFGSHMEGSPERDPSPVPKPSPNIIRKTDQESFSNKGIYFSCSRIKDRSFLLNSLTRELGGWVFKTH